MTDSALLNIDELGIVEKPEHPLRAMIIGVGDNSLVPKRLLHPGSLDLWIMY